MDTRHMRYFVALAETLHFGQAAARMNMSQPPFSRQILSIERILGVRLFDRNSRNVTLTAAGKHYLNDCRAVLEQFDSACQDVKLVASGMKGEVRLGFMMHAAHRVVPTLVRLFSAQRPDVRLILDERTPADINEMLVDGMLDAAVTLSSGPARHLRSTSLRTERLRLIAPMGHALASMKEVQPRHLDGAKLIAAPASVAPTLREAIGRYCAVGGVVPNFAFEPRLQQTIIRLVAEGLGVAMVPEQLCTDLAEGIISVPLVESPEFDIVLCAPLASTNSAVSILFEIVEADPSAFGWKEEY
ncbi:LysR substrate-binding domain-containing protein (plasmid) [Agrobacterium leguminum]|uniref:LysR family transcriptional regulator n=1 Tax=Agrobacterium leguminum TaxID=2792015 RepID=UPI0030CC26CF